MQGLSMYEAVGCGGCIREGWFSAFEGYLKVHEYGKRFFFNFREQGFED